TIFVAPAFVGGGTFWWDALAPSEGGGLDPAVRARALDAWRGVDAEVRVRAAEIGVAASPLAEHARCATEGELAAAAASHPGLVYGSHTWGHPNLARLRQDELAAELARPLAWLRERFARVSLVLSYPYGLATTETERAAAAAGYRAAVRIDGGWMPLAPSNVFALPRLNVPAGVTSSGFLLRAAGVVGG
ncbi:MAG: polysaccharide deacetylase family protein, partial [Gemmatimonadaceae bacterium]